MIEMRRRTPTMPARPFSVVRGLRLPNLERERKIRLLTQAQLAEKAGVDRTTVNRAERGRHVDLLVVKRIADALGVDAATLARAE